MNTALLARAQTFVDQKYTTHSDRRQASMGLAYVEVERADLAKEIARFAESETKSLQLQPIETAPKDGTQVLVYVPRRLGALYAGAVNPTGVQWWSRNLGDVQPTHWMPLPEPPR